MTIPRHILRLMAALLALLVPALAGAVITNPTPQRSYVSLQGSDSNNCGPAAPCRTWQAALAQTEDGGEVLTLDSGGFGTLNITQGVTIIVPSGIYGGMSPAAGVGITINAPGKFVALRGLTLQAQGASVGVQVAAAQTVLVDGCVVSDFPHGIDLLGSSTNTGTVTIRDTDFKNDGTAVQIVDGNHVHITGSSIENAYLGVHVVNTTAGTTVVGIDHLHISGAFSYGVNVDYAGAPAGAVARVEVSDSVIDGAGSTAVATYVNANGDGRIEVNDSVLTNGYIGILSELTASGGQSNVIARHCTILENGYGIASLGGGTIGSSGDNLLVNSTNVYGSLTSYASSVQ